jgi:hypothetical protein
MPGMPKAHMPKSCAEILSYDNFLHKELQGHAFGAPHRPTLAEFACGDASTSRDGAKRRDDHRQARRGSQAARRLRGGRPAAPSRAEALGARRRRQVSRPAPAGRQSLPQRGPDDRDHPN